MAATHSCGAILEVSISRSYTPGRWTATSHFPDTLHGFGDRFVAPRGSVALDDDRGWAPCTDEKHGHSVQLSCTSAKDAQPLTVVVMVPDIDGNADARAAERPNRRVHRAERGHHKRLKVGALATRPKAHAGQKPRRRGGLHPVDPEVHPQSGKAIDEAPGDSRLARTRDAVQDDHRTTSHG
jgi:hypothetical protein